MFDSIIMAIWDDFFNVFLYGSGGWLGLLIMIAIVILVTAKVKVSGFLFMAVAVFVAIQYLNQVSVNSNFMWSALIMFLMAIYCIVIGLYGVKEKV